MPSQPTGQAGQAPLLEGDSGSDKASDFGLTDSSTEDDDNEMKSFMTHHTTMLLEKQSLVMHD